MIEIFTVFHAWVSLLLRLLSLSLSHSNLYKLDEQLSKLSILFSLKYILLCSSLVNFRHLVSRVKNSQPNKMIAGGTIEERYLENDELISVFNWSNHEALKLKS